MALPIEDTKLGTNLVSATDFIFEAEALPSIATTTSSEFLLGNTMGRVELKVIVATAGTLTAALTVNVTTSATSGGTFAEVATFTIALGAIALDQELVQWIAPKENSNLYTKVELVTTANESAMAVNAVLAYVS